MARRLWNLGLLCAALGMIVPRAHAEFVAFTLSGNVASVEPEPAVYALVGAGMLALAIVRRRRR